MAAYSKMHTIKHTLETETMHAVSRKSCINHHSSKERQEQIVNGKATAACDLMRFNIVLVGNCLHRLVTLICSDICKTGLL